MLSFFVQTDEKCLRWNATAVEVSKSLEGQRRERSERNFAEDAVAVPVDWGMSSPMREPWKCPTNINKLYDVYVIMIVLIVYTRRLFVHLFVCTVAHFEWPQYIFCEKKTKQIGNLFHGSRGKSEQIQLASTFHFVRFGTWLCCFLLLLPPSKVRSGSLSTKKLERNWNRKKTLRKLRETKRDKWEDATQ